ncbi:MFS transporter [Streptomyces caniscabiei]|uniref:MFS transporter n=1 Tax=Streptomyces caniscabiei TaxID=2746961 RepID=A0A927L5Y8_9ACTN|nr:MFS transporter [Streptomyces caniscabiei]MBD9725899.1 MFS transporter [Streptomyces caniscabiei]MDX3507617.1 MFS transporter [Streptomyces caniscabiei]MDX3717579.1 MFS transporter [Streptomyces caniscabiei]WEO25331.1 MFS transporter [Streptomyces caniscabiei]
MTAAAKELSLFRQGNFLLLWSSQSISLFGAQLTYVALPLTAVVILHATPMESGILGALTTLPFLLFGLGVGALLDRRTRRPVLIAADVVRAVALAWIPIAYALDVLSIPQLFVVAFVVGTMTVLFDLAYQSYLPTTIGRARMMEANAKMQVSESMAEVVGPGAAGALIGLLSAPLVIAADAVSYLLSSVAVLKLPPDESPAGNKEQGESAPSLWMSIREGVDVVRRHPILRWCTAAAVLANLFESALLSVFFLFLIRDVGLGSTQVGLIVAVGGAGAVVGALFVERLTRLLGAGPMLVAAMALPGIGYLLLGSVHGASVWTVGVAATANFVALFGLPIFNVTVISFRQVVTPDHLLGRVNATVRTFAWSALSLGSLMGGALGSTLGLRGTVLVSACGGFLASLLLFFSPLRSVRQLNEAEAAEAESTTDLALRADAEEFSESLRGPR